jgi:hypothetical protein
VGRATRCVGAAMIVLSIVSACGSRPACRAPEPGASSHPRRDECLAAPWIAGERAGTLRHEVIAEREHLLIREGTRAWTEDEITAVRASDPSLMETEGVLGIGHGLCGEGRDGTCLRIDLRLCAMTLDALAERFEAALATIPTEATAMVHVQLAGATGPRCEAGTAACGPLGYNVDEPLPPGDVCARSPLSWTVDRGLSHGACAHDGECIRAGCGNHCVAWPDGDFDATCEGYTELEQGPARCGCVAGHCSWFD